MRSLCPATDGVSAVHEKLTHLSAATFQLQGKVSHTYVEKGDCREHVLKIKRIHMNMCGYILNPFFQAEYAGSSTKRSPEAPPTKFYQDG